jgi:CheY-like chemotaxis protein
MMLSADQKQPEGLLLSDDLIFTSRITTEAKAQGLSVVAVRSVATLVDHARQHLPHGILLDLAFPGLDVNELFLELRGACASLPRVVAYGPHVDVEALRAARAAGCDPVLPRSKFVEVLGVEIGKWLS